MTAPILQIKNLNVSFSPGTLAVADLNVDVPAGSTVALVGESGSGKTVTALSICRLVRPEMSSGAILWNGDRQNLDLLAAPEREVRLVRGREIGYVFQDPGSSFNPVMTVGEQIVEAYRTHLDASHSEAVKEALEHLALVHLNDPERVFHSYPHELSGGMRQRAMIAMALISGPRLLIADEPTTALDVTVEAGILKLLAELKEQKALTLLFITHDLGLATGISDRIVVMQKGRAVETLERTNGFSFKEPYTKMLFSAGLSNTRPKTIIEVG